MTGYRRVAKPAGRMATGQTHGESLCDPAAVAGSGGGGAPGRAAAPARVESSASRASSIIAAIDFFQGLPAGIAVPPAGARGAFCESNRMTGTSPFQPREPPL